MFETSLPFAFFDYFRVPYRVDERAGVDVHTLSPGGPLERCGRLRWLDREGGGAVAYWVPAGGSPLGGAATSQAEHRLGTTPLYGTVVPDAASGRWLAATGADWTPTTPVYDASGARVASVWRAGDGSLYLPFDPGQVIANYWSEGYKDLAGRTLSAQLKRLAVRAYYRLRPALPRAAQLALRRGFSHVQARSRFPRWPVEPALHDFYRLLFGWSADVAGTAVPWLAPWPNGHTWALVLTHDVETQVGYDNLAALRGVELAAGYRSSWNFVPMRYTVDDALVADLVTDGFEVGVHGLYHDGRDLESESVLSERLPAIRRHARRWQAVGFRSPATHRVWDWMPRLGFDYDSSYPDTDPFEPQSGGCCSLLPFFNRDMVELPITLPQDHTLFAILRQPDERLWVDKARRIRQAQGMALMIAHPDYLLERPRLDAYRRFLETFAADPSVWRALPKDVSAWWRRRAASTVERAGGSWRIRGPAADEGVVSLDPPSSLGACSASSRGAAP